MKILHVIYSLDPARGGPPAVAARLAAAQAMRGHQVTLLSHAAPTRQQAIAQALRNVPHLEKVTLSHLPPAEGLSRAILVYGRRQLQQAVAAADVVHIHGVWEPILPAAASAARARGVPYVVRPAGMLDPWSMQQKRWKKFLAMALVYRRMLNGAAFLHTLNRDEEQLVRPLGLQCPVKVIPNGVFFEELEPLPTAGTFYQQHPELQGRPFVLFLSRLHYKKGLDYLADAFAIVAAAEPEVQLVVAGPDGGDLARFTELIEQSKIRPRTHLVGPLYGTDKLAALVDATCFCLPSRQEGFSVAITEALACGVPVVASDACHFPEIAGAGAGYVVVLEPQAIAAALLKVVGDAGLRQQMGKAGRALIESRFTWDKIAEQTLAAYTQAPGSSRAS
ncbi:MAG TPA: glycosyltransferase [Tepidisphaeraceae bacterium]|nr:glycosyltransferase [Tepidisphaeraceae bacterium]